MSEATPIPPRVEHKCDVDPRCSKCGKRLAGFAGRPWEIKCERCGQVNSSS